MLNKCSWMIYCTTCLFTSWTMFSSHFMSLGVTLSNIRLLSPFLKVQDKFSFQYRETTDVLNLFAAGCLSVAQEIFWLIFHVLKHALNWNIAKIENAFWCHSSNCWVTSITRVGWSQSKSMSLSSQGLISSHDINNGISCLIVSTSLSCTFRVFSKWSYLCHCHRYLSKVTSTFGYHFWSFSKWSCLCLCLFIVNFVKCLKVSRIALYLCSQKYLTQQV